MYPNSNYNALGFQNPTPQQLQQLQQMAAASNGDSNNNNNNSTGSNNNNYRLQQLNQLQQLQQLQQMNGGGGSVGANGAQYQPQLNGYQFQLQLHALQQQQQQHNSQTMGLKSPNANGFAFGSGSNGSVSSSLKSKRGGGGSGSGSGSGSASIGNGNASSVSSSNGSASSAHSNGNSNGLNLTRGSLFNNLQPPINQQVAYSHGGHSQQLDNVPQTPFDLNYGALMLPRNLLMSSPFIGSSFNSPLTATMSPGANYQQSKYMTATGPAPPIIGAPPKNRRKAGKNGFEKTSSGLKESALANSNKPTAISENEEEEEEDVTSSSSSDEDIIVTEGDEKDDEKLSTEVEDNEKFKKSKNQNVSAKTSKSGNEQRTKRKGLKSSKHKSRPTHGTLSLSNPELENVPVTVAENKLALSKKSIILRHINPKVKIYEFLNYLKFGPLQFCYIMDHEEEINDRSRESSSTSTENEIKLKFIYKRTHYNFLNHLHLYISEFYQEFESPNATYKIVDYDIKDDYQNATALKYIIQSDVDGETENPDDYVDLEYEIEVNKATRCVKIYKFTEFDLLNDDHENLEKKLRLGYGEVDLINTNEDRNIMTIHFLNLVSSIKLYKELVKINQSKIADGSDSKKHLGTVKYSEDRCRKIDDDEFEQTFGQTSDFDEHLENESDKISSNAGVVSQGSFASFDPHQQFLGNGQSLSQQNLLLNGIRADYGLPLNLQNVRHDLIGDLSLTFQTLTAAPSGPGSDLYLPMLHNISSLNPTENRTVYLGNLSSKTTVEEVCNVVRGGILQAIKLISEKHICFITFISAASATQFFASSNMNGLTIHNKKIKVGWGKNPGDLPNSIALAVTVGASRNVYIGVKDDDEEGSNGLNVNQPRVVPDEDTLRNDFSKWGEIEQINFFKDGFCAFVNFMNIGSAIKAIDEFNGPEKDSVHQSFGNKYTHYKINFAKDRCGNPPKLVNSKPKKKKNKNKNHNSINNNNKTSSPNNNNNSNTNTNTNTNINIKSDAYKEKAKSTAESASQSTPRKSTDSQITDKQALALASIGITSQLIDEKVKGANPEQPNETSSEDSDIKKQELGSESSKTQKQVQKPQKIKSEIPVSQSPRRLSTSNLSNSSGLSASPATASNSGYQNYSQPPPQQYTPVQQHAQFYSGAVMDSFTSPNGFLQQNLLMSKAQPRKTSQGYHSKQQSVNSNASNRSSVNGQVRGGTSGASSTASLLGGAFGSSGSQVMAQYLAKAQFDSLLFAPNGTGSDHDDGKKGRRNSKKSNASKK